MSLEFTTHFQYKRLEKKIEEAEARRVKVSTEASEAPESFGDLVDNAEFECAAKAEHLIESRLRELEKEKSKYQVVDVSNPDISKASICTTIKTVDLFSRKIQIYNLIGAGPVDIDKDEVPYNSLIGRTLYGLKVGESREVTVPAGKIKLLIIDIKKYDPCE